MRYALNKAEEYENKRIGLLSGASYVVGTIDDDLLHEVEGTDFSKLKWPTERKLIVITGARGKLVLRCGRIDLSGRFVELKPPAKPVVYASLPLLRAIAHEPIQFISDNLNAPVVRIRKTNKGGKQFVGLLIGERDASYSSLVSIETDRLLLTDVEPNAKGGGGKEATVVFDVDPQEEQKVRAQFAEFVRSARFDYDSPYNANTQLVLSAPVANA